ncbi:MAG: hypothetical protein PHV05_00180 [Candidatus Riflebacteria bacterium]|nr:hypothetical protein [Candidatus Riflebacteria bacterium]
MKHVFLLSAILFLVVMTSGSAYAGSPTDGYIPTWKVGDRWVLEATYRDLKSEGEVWLPPIQWVFKVRAMKTVDNQKCYVVHIFPNKGDMKNQAILWLSVDDLKPMRVIDIFPTNEGMKHAERDLDPSGEVPLLAEDTLIPYDLPVFPLNRANTAAQGADGFSAYRGQAAEKKFAKIRNIGGLSFKRTVAQKNKAPEKQYADTFAAYRSSGAAYQVEIDEPRSSTDIVQLWQKGSPWALSSENRDRKVRLVPSSAPESGSANENGGEF